MRRNRARYAVLVLAAMAAGLASRKFPGLLPAPLGKYPGDALWALMVLLLCGMAWPRWPVGRVAVVALATCFAVEFSQLCQADWLHAIRRTTPGHLVLGSTFHPPDLLAYAVGVSVGAALEALWWRRHSGRFTRRPQAALPSRRPGG